MKTWIISDTHFHHKNILTFKDDDENIIRDFKDVDEMNQFLVNNWNSVVKKDDKVYHLGDVAMSTSAWAFEILRELNGRKILIKGNHDNARLNIYSRHFDDIRSSHLLRTGSGRKVFLSHIPIHSSSLRNNFNVHGHLHHRIIEDDFRYINVSCEMIGYKPINFIEIIDLIREREEIIKW